MNDPWDVKSVRQSNQYMSCMKINGVPLLPPVLSKECRKEMQYYKLLAKEVEKRIQTLKPYIKESDTESSDDKTDAPDLPESEHSYVLPQEDFQRFNVDNDKINAVTTEKCLEDCEISRVQGSNTFDNITSNFDTDSASSKLSSKFVIDLSLSLNEAGKHVNDYSGSPPIDVPERDFGPKVYDNSSINNGHDSTIKDEKLSFSVSINKNVLVDPTTDIAFNNDGPSSLSSKSFTGSLNDIHMESVKVSQAAPLVRQRSYTVLKPSPMLLAHLEVQSINTGVEVTSISMSESLSNISNTNKKRRSWDLESAKQKWSSMALELKKKNITSASKSAYKAANDVAAKPVRKVQSVQPKTKSLTQDRTLKRSPPKNMSRSDSTQRPKKAESPVRNSHPTQSSVKTPNTPIVIHKKEIEKQKPISESDDPAARVRELYEKIQKQQLIQMANLVEKQKKEQMLLQQVFEEQNNLLFTQLKTICPKSPTEIKEAWNDKNNTIPDRGPVSLSQVINHKPQPNPCESPVLSTLTETNNYLNYCDNVLKKSRDITGSIKKQTTKNNNHENYEKINSPNQPSCGSRTRTQSPNRRNTPTSRKLTYETGASSDREYDPILTDRTNDTMADLNVTFPSDRSEDCQPFMHNSSGPNSGHYTIRGSVMESPLTAPVMAASCRSTDRAIRSMEETIQNSINSMCYNRTNKKSVMRPPTAHERAAATKIVAYAKGFLVRRLMKTERVEATVQTIKDALLCALQLHQDREGIQGADVDLHRRLIQQITAACYSLHDTFVASSARERCAHIAADRARRHALAARRQTPFPTTPDVMSQSHSGAFPTRAKRHPPSLMTQSNYETFSGDKSLRRYMPSPRRRPWR